jgi:polyisoprenoid-binding protein YceI
MRRPAALAAAALLALLAIGAGAAYLYFFSSLRTAPRPLALASASPVPSAGASAAAGDSLAGSWSAGSGSEAGYRVSEQFAGQTSPHEAVARTSQVTGGLTVRQGAGGLEASGLDFAAQLAGLRSVDQVAGFDVANRDRIVASALGVSRFPSARFQADPVQLPPELAAGGVTSLTVPGQLTVHGVTRPATVALQAQRQGSQVRVTGSTSFDMTDFGVQPPRVPFTSVRPQVTVEFELALVRA